MNCFAGWPSSIDGGGDSHLRLFVVDFGGKAHITADVHQPFFATAIKKTRRYLRPSAFRWIDYPYVLGAKLAAQLDLI